MSEITANWNVLKIDYVGRYTITYLYLLNEEPQKITGRYFRHHINNNA